MKYLLLVHHNEDRFNKIPEDTRKAPHLSLPMSRILS